MADSMTEMEASVLGLMEGFTNWSDLAQFLVVHYRKRGGKEEIIHFDNADPGFTPFKYTVRFVRSALEKKPRILGKYGLSNDDYNPEIIIPFIESLGILPPSNSRTRSGQPGFNGDNLTSGLGATHLYTLAVESLIREGDALMITAPTYGIFSLHPILQRIPIRTVQLHAKDDWKLNPGNLERRVSEVEREGLKVRLFLHMNPHNPLGTVEDQYEVADIASVFRKHEVTVIDDLAYSGIEYDGKRAVPMASVEGMANQTLTLFSLSKAYGAPGLRSGLAVGPEEIISRLVGRMMRRFEAPPLTSQGAICGVFNMLDQIVLDRNDYLTSNSAEYENRRNLVHALVSGLQGIPSDELRQSAIRLVKSYGKEYHDFDRSIAGELLKSGIPGLRPLNTPGAGYFQVLDFSHFRGRYHGQKKIETSMDITRVVAEESGIVVLPGEMMQFEGKELVARITYALSPGKILNGLNRLSKALGTLKEQPYQR